MTDDETEIVEVELDPARSMMYREAMEAGGPIAQAMIEQSVRETVQKLYDNRGKLKERMMEQSNQQPDPSKLVEQATNEQEADD